MFLLYDHWINHSIYFLITVLHSLVIYCYTADYCSMYYRKQNKSKALALTYEKMQPGPCEGAEKKKRDREADRKRERERESVCDKKEEKSQKKEGPSCKWRGEALCFSDAKCFRRVERQARQSGGNGGLWRQDTPRYAPRWGETASGK